MPLKREPTKKPHRRRAIGKTLALQIVVVLLAPLGAKSYGALVSLAVGNGGHHALGDTEAPLGQRMRKDVIVGGGGTCVSEEATADAFGMDLRAIGDPKVCTSRVRRVM